MHAAVIGIDSPPLSATIGPIALHERLQRLDVNRGFALFGILLMNVGLRAQRSWRGHAGGDERTGPCGWLARPYLRAWQIWTMVSMRFGMGLAVMLSRAHSAGRACTWPIRGARSIGRIRPWRWFTCLRRPQM